MPALPNSLNAQLPLLEKIWAPVTPVSRNSKELDEHLDAALLAVQQSKPVVFGFFWPDFSKTLVRHPFRTKLVFFRSAAGELQSRTVAEVLREIIEGKR
ncbi:hypothetical protein HY994_00330 [Candidatus Micrarchaeota archaeon]|nr:hypothetical protein [Candidatus Micrarchaeota archaeon]